MKLIKTLIILVITAATTYSIAMEQALSSTSQKEIKARLFSSLLTSNPTEEAPFDVNDIRNLHIFLSHNHENALAKLNLLNQELKHLKEVSTTSALFCSDATAIRNYSQDVLQEPNVSILLSQCENSMSATIKAFAQYMIYAHIQIEQLKQKKT